MRCLKVNVDVLEMVECAKKNNGEIYIYYEHAIDEPEIVNLEYMLDGIEEGERAQNFGLAAFMRKNGSKRKMVNATKGVDLADGVIKDVLKHLREKLS